MSLRLFLLSFFLFTLLSFANAATVSLGGGFLSTSFFNATASSTCGEDTPPINATACPPGDHSIQAAFDGNLSTWWQSEDEDDPAMFNFTLKVRVQ